MSDYIITTDSGCDLPLSELQKHNIIPFMLQYEIDDVLFTDTMLHEDCHLFYEKMRAGAAPHTSQINAQQFVDFWKPLLKNGLPILHISLGSGVSGTYRNGTLARAMLLEDFPDAEIYVLDSTLCSVGYGMLA